MQGMDFVGDVGEFFVVEWAFSVEWASGREEIRCWLSNCVGEGDIGTWGCEGFVGKDGRLKLHFFHCPLLLRFDRY